MRIHSLYVYPIKSLRGIPLDYTQVTSLGFSYDRTFLLQRVDESTPIPKKNLHIGHHDELCLFTPSFLHSTSTSLSSPPEPECLKITYTPPPTGSTNRKIFSAPNEIIVPLRPAVEKLSKVEVVMHRSECEGWDMGSAYNDFFTECLGFDARLVYLGGSRRKVLGSVAPATPAPSQESSLLGSLSSMISGILPSASAVSPLPGNRAANGNGNSNGVGNKTAGIGTEVTFADCAPLLITTLPSLKAVEAMLPEDGRDGVDITKFRPNILLAPDNDDGKGEELAAWEEDFWAELEVGVEGGTRSNGKDGVGEGDEGSAKRVVLTANCARCKSINVDYATASQPPPSKQTLKAMMKDRRVDEGMKYSPVFGRYGFLDSPTTVTIKVGFKVDVVKRNSERGVFYWPGLSVGTRN